MSAHQSWHVGMKVVCIASPIIIATGMKNFGARYPVSGGVYTLREIRDDAPWGGKAIVVLLSEINNEHMIGSRRMGTYAHVEPGFNVRGFRPLEARKTDISIFRQMLLSQPKKEPSPAVFSDQETPA